MLRIECRLVHVHSDCPETLFSCRFDNAYSTSSGSMVNDISTGLVLRKGIFFSKLGIVESACIVDYYFSIWIYRFYTGFKTVLELFDQGELHAANKPHLVCISHESRDYSCKE